MKSGSADIPFVRPVVAVSQCLGFAAVRYNGAIINDAFVQRLARHVDIVELCPEVGIGLGVPRDPIRMERSDNGVALVQPATGRDITRDMHAWSALTLDALPAIDGFVLKSRSPSCGVADVSVFARGSQAEEVDGTGPGLFAGAVLERFPDHPVCDEIQLRDPEMRDHFLTCIHALARFRSVEASQRSVDLVAFHTMYKYLLMAHAPARAVELGRIVADGADAFLRYGRLLRTTLREPASRRGHANALSHMFGYVSHSLTADERAAHADSIQRYRRGDIARALVVDALRRIAGDTGQAYLETQAYFRPYPGELK